MFPPSFTNDPLTLWVDESSSRCISVIFQDILQFLILHIVHFHLLATFSWSIQRNRVSARANSLHSDKSSNDTRVFQRQSVSSIRRQSLSMDQNILSSLLFAVLLARSCSHFTSLFLILLRLNSPTLHLPMGNEMLVLKLTGTNGISEEDLSNSQSQ